MTILGKQYKVKYLDDDTLAGAFGTCNRDHGLILINNEKTKDQQAETIIHEVLHAIDLELILGLDEETIARLAVGLYSAGMRCKNG